jgi:AAA+ ATPase superfamily predicted ATPase
MKKMKIIGRKSEQVLLAEYAASSSPEFLAVYGRRRVGKTFLIREYFGDRFAFYCTGLFGAAISTQLKSFALALKRSCESAGRPMFEIPSTWLEAFEQLTRFLESLPPGQKKVVFLDEMPWMSTHRGGFITALEHFWNSWAASRSDILLIVCGSAASWLVDKVISSHGGLHNRVTKRMHIKPFTLAECKDYLDSRRIKFSPYQILEMYMILGGIPYYLSLLEKGFSLPQNIDRLCFSEDGSLRDEYHSLYASLFINSENHVKVVQALAKKKIGMTRAELLASAKLSDGGEFSKILEDLELSGFIRSYFAFGNKTKGMLYQLIDFFTLYYLQFMSKKNYDEHFWTNHIDNSAHRAWSGYAFEIVVLTHLDAVKKKLGISGVAASVSSWRSRGNNSSKGAQIDMVIDRNDNVINLCEIKYCQGIFTIDKAYADNLSNKVSTFAAETKTRKALHLTLVSTYGAAANEYAGLLQSEVTMEDLFR